MSGPLKVRELRTQPVDDRDRPLRVWPTVGTVFPIPTEGGRQLYEVVKADQHRVVLTRLHGPRLQEVAEAAARHTLALQAAVAGYYLFAGLVDACAVALVRSNDPVRAAWAVAHLASADAVDPTRYVAPRARPWRLRWALYRAARRYGVALACVAALLATGCRSAESADSIPLPRIASIGRLTHLYSWCHEGNRVYWSIGVGGTLADNTHAIAVVSGGCRQ